MFEGVGDGGFTGGGEAGEPECGSTLGAKGFALVMGEGGRMPGYVAAIGS